MYAIFETGGKQYRVSKGDTVFIEKLNLEAGDSVEFDKVLALSTDDGLNFGKPYLKNAKVTAEVEKNGKGKKIIVFRYKAKKGYSRKQGHRQPYTKIKITDITQ